MRTTLSLLVLAFAAALPASAQATLTADVAVNSQYQWRGLTTTNRPVIQPDVIVAVPLSPFTVSLGAWGNIEAGRYDDALRHVSQNGGAGITLAEFDLWIEASRAFGDVTVTTGALAYAFPNDAGVTRAANTAELYVKAAADVPLSPSAAVWQDVRKVSGAYAEAAIAQDIRRVRLSATSGWNLGQSIGDGGALGYYARRGFTHADIAASTAWTSSGGIVVAPSLHVLLTGDATTRVSSPGRTSGAKIWFGTTISWSRVLQNDTNPSR